MSTTGSLHSGVDRMNRYSHGTSGSVDCYTRFLKGSPQSVKGIGTMVIQQIL